MTSDHSQPLNGMKALVTGASAGLGAHFAGVLAAAGAEVIVGARRADDLDMVAERIRLAGGRCSSILLDVTRAESIDALGDRLDVDILVNNAGVVREAPALDTPESD